MNAHDERRSYEYFDGFGNTCQLKNCSLRTFWIDVVEGVKLKIKIGHMETTPVGHRLPVDIFFARHPGKSLPTVQ
jgi:hypothetical protein